MNVRFSRVPIKAAVGLPLPSAQLIEGRISGLENSLLDSH
jgi:hypothetical protein